jgi:hypothetical protein
LNYTIVLTESAAETLQELAADSPKKLKKVRKALGLMETNIRHPGLQTHEFTSLSGPNGEKVFEAYVENRTPGAYRIFWYYGPQSGEITVFAMTPHP